MVMDLAGSGGSALGWEGRLTKMKEEGAGDTTDAAVASRFGA
jgi:hypothetical protein